MKRVAKWSRTFEPGENSNPTQNLLRFDSLEYENNWETFFPKDHFG